MPHFQMLIGLPGSGKTTWFAEQDLSDKNFVWISTDKFIERLAKQKGKTYNEVWKDNIKSATNQMVGELRTAINTNKDIIFDQTNLSIKSRRQKLQNIPSNYTKEAVIFLTSPEIIDIINVERKQFGRAIPQHILESMRRTFDISFINNEGFDKITYIQRS